MKVLDFFAQPILVTPCGGLKWIFYYGNGFCVGAAIGVVTLVQTLAQVLKRLAHLIFVAVHVTQI